MKWRLGRFTLEICAILALPLFVVCSDKPSNSQIEETLTAELKSNIPISWVGNLMGGKNAKIDKIEIKKWGSFNKEQRYWPVMIRVTGSAELNDPFNQGKIRQFDAVSEFRFYKDDYGEWKASLSRGLFQ